MAVVPAHGLARGDRSRAQAEHAQDRRRRAYPLAGPARSGFRTGRRRDRLSAFREVPPPCAAGPGSPPTGVSLVMFEGPLPHRPSRPLPFGREPRTRSSTGHSGATSTSRQRNMSRPWPGSAAHHGPRGAGSLALGHPSADPAARDAVRPAAVPAPEAAAGAEPSTGTGFRPRPRPTGPPAMPEAPSPANGRCGP